MIQESGTHEYEMRFWRRILGLLFDCWVAWWFWCCIFILWPILKKRRAFVGHSTSLVLEPMSKRRWERRNYLFPQDQRWEATSPLWLIVPITCWETWKPGRSWRRSQWPVIFDAIILYRLNALPNSDQGCGRSFCHSLYSLPALLADFGHLLSSTGVPFAHWHVMLSQDSIFTWCNCHC